MSNEKYYIQTTSGARCVKITDELREAMDNGEVWRIHMQALEQAHIEIIELKQEIYKLEASELSYKFMLEKAKEQVAKLTVEQAFGMASVEDYES